MEALKLWRNRKQIFEGLRNSVFRKESVEAIASDRMEICNTCPHIDKKGSKCEVPLTGPCCGLCGCSLKLKTRSLAAACDDARWGVLLDGDEQQKVYDEIGFKLEE